MSYVTQLVTKCLKVARKKSVEMTPNLDGGVFQIQSIFLHLMNCSASDSVFNAVVDKFGCFRDVNRVRILRFEC